MHVGRVLYTMHHASQWLTERLAISQLPVDMLIGASLRESHIGVRNLHNIIFYGAYVTRTPLYIVYISALYIPAVA